MPVQRRDNRTWESKWLGRERTPESGAPQSNGTIVPEDLASNPLYRELIDGLPELKRNLLDELLGSLMDPRKAQK